MSSITIYVKNMAGEMITLEVPQGSTLEEIPTRLSELDEKQFPYFCTKVMRMEAEEKEEMKEEVMEGEILVSFVSTVGVEKVIREELESPLTRLILPFGKEFIYIYPMSRHAGGGRIICCGVEHFIPSSEQCPTPRCRSEARASSYLATAVRNLVPSITAPQLEAIHEIVRQYYRELGAQTKEKFQLLYPPEMSYKCGCGSVIKGSSTASHEKTKKHQAYLESLKQ